MAVSLVTSCWRRLKNVTLMSYKDNSNKLEVKYKSGDLLAHPVVSRHYSAPPCWRRQRHLDAEDATPAVIGSMTVKRDGLRLLISPRLFSSAPNLLCFFHICCFSASTRCFPLPFCLIRCICALTPPAGCHFYIPTTHGLAEECLQGGACMDSLCSLCKCVTPPPPPNLPLIMTCISNSDLCLLNLELLWFSALSASRCFIHNSPSLRGSAHDTLAWIFTIAYFNHTTRDLKVYRSSKS